MRRRWPKVRRPEYTGENRCVPCTVLNLLVGVSLSGILALTVSPVAGALTLVVSVAAISLRGYLVPGTPTITAHYFPDWVLAAFGKESVSPAHDAEEGAHGVLEALGVTERDESGSRRLSSEFRRAWNEQIRRLKGEEWEHELVADLFGVEPNAVSALGDDAALVGDERLIRWPSDAARIADLAVGQTPLSDRSAWDELGVDARVEALARLRTLQRECPACGGPVSRTVRRVESCCQPTTVVVSAVCDECGAPLAESERVTEKNSHGSVTTSHESDRYG